MLLLHPKALPSPKIQSWHYHSSRKLADNSLSLCDPPYVLVQHKLSLLALLPKAQQSRDKRIDTVDERTSLLAGEGMEEGE